MVSVCVSECVTGAGVGKEARREEYLAIGYINKRYSEDR